MIHSLKTVRVNARSLPLTWKNAIGLRATTISGQPNRSAHSRDKNPKEKTGDVRSNSVGDGYSTRSDEEGFGGTFTDNQSIPMVDMDKLIHENHPAYDKKQTSEVKEKENPRHQSNESSPR